MKAKTKNSLKKIIKFAKEGKLKAKEGNGCVYHDKEKGTYCAIGCLLSKNLLKELEENNMNDGLSASGLFEEYPDLETKLGFTSDQADVIQAMHDNWVDGRSEKRKFISTLEKLISGKITGVGTSRFTGATVSF